MSPDVDAWRRLAQLHVADRDVAGVLARALATVLDPDIYNVERIVALDPHLRYPSGR